MKRFSVVIGFVFASSLLLVGCQKQEPDADRRLPEAFGSALWDVHDFGLLPDGTQLEYVNLQEAEKNQFAFCDVDGDGREELLISWSNASMAGKEEFVFDCDGDTCYIELCEFPSVRYYDNGSVEADWAHNQGRAGRIWPRNFYLYDAETDTYKEYGSMDAWDKSFAEEGFPDEIDADGNGLIYYLTPADGNGEKDKETKRLWWTVLYIRHGPKSVWETGRSSSRIIRL